MEHLTLVGAFRRYEYNDALFDEQPHDGLTLKIGAYKGALINAMRAMAVDRAYDVCEMSPAAYLTARQAGAPLIGLPVFPYGQYPLDQIVVREDSSLARAEDIARANTIVVRTWGQPTAVWARHYLMDYLGIDLQRVRWMFVNEDPVPGTRRPEGAVQRRGETLESVLASGDADVAIGVHEVPPGARTLIADPEAAAAQWARETGIVPANHLLVIDARYGGTDAPDRVCRRFDAIVRDYLGSGVKADGMIADLLRINPEAAPLPSGREANARMWQTHVAAMVRQGIVAPVADPLSLLHDWEPARG